MPVMQNSEAGAVMVLRPALLRTEAAAARPMVRKVGGVTTALSATEGAVEAAPAGSMARRGQSETEARTAAEV